MEPGTQPPPIPFNVEYNLKKPCDDCPFKKSTPFHVGVAQSIQGYADSLDAGTFAHTCHKTENRPECDGPRNHAGKAEHCFGALLMILKTSLVDESFHWMQSGLVNGLRACPK